MFSTTYAQRHRNDIKGEVKTTQETVETTQKTTQKTDETTQKTTQKVLRLIAANPSVTTRELAIACDLTEDGIKWQLKKLRTTGAIRRVGPDKGGHWEVIQA